MLLRLQKWEMHMVFSDDDTELFNTTLNPLKQAMKDRILYNTTTIRTPGRMHLLFSRAPKYNRTYIIPQ